MLPGVGASCVLSAPAISRVTASVGNKVVYTWTAGAWSGTYTVSGYAWNYYSNSSRWYSYQVGCGGTPAHTALGTQSGLTVDLAGRRLTWRPRTTALLGDWDAAVRIRAEGPASGGGYLRTAYVWVRLTATAACGTTAYAADRRSIALYTASPAAYGYGSLALETYALGDGGATYGGDGDVGLAFRYDYTPAGCAYYLEYEVATTWKATGASGRSRAELADASHEPGRRGQLRPGEQRERCARRPLPRDCPQQALRRGPARVAGFHL
jgi:hypothetical protein